MIRLSIIGDWYATADSFGKYVRHSEAKAEIDRLRGVLAVHVEVVKEFQDGRRYSNVHTRQVARDIQNTIAARAALAEGNGQEGGV